MKFGIKKIGGLVLIGAVTLALVVVSPFDREIKEGPGVDPTFIAEIVKVSESIVMESSEEQVTVRKLSLKVADGSTKSEIQLEDDGTFFQGKKQFEVGDEIMVGKNVAGEFYIKDLVRSHILYWLIGLFVLVVLGVTGVQGLGSLAGLAFSFVVLFKLVLPGILVGQDPLMMAILGAAFIIPGTFYLSHGFSRKTSVAVLGTLVALVCTGLLSILFAELSVLTGLAVEEANFLQAETRKVIDFQGLLLAGMIISILGILDDITISQSSIVQQLINAKKKISFVELYSRAMKVGRDHIASMVNTLVLVYAGASLALLLLFLDYSEKFLQVINYEFMAQEIVQTLVGSIGLIIAVPLTTLIACLLLKPTKDDVGHEHEGHHGHVH